MPGTLCENCQRTSCEEGGDDVKSARPLRARATHVLQWPVQRAATTVTWMRISESRSQFGSKSATRLREVGFASNRDISNDRGEYVPGPCTHRPSNNGELGVPKVAVI